MLDSNISTYIDKDGNVQEVGSGGVSEYTNTSEIVDDAITLTSTSTLNDLVTQILANKTKVVRAHWSSDLRRLINGTDSNSDSDYVIFKIVSYPDSTPSTGAYETVNGLIECYSYLGTHGGPTYVQKQLLHSYTGGDGVSWIAEGWIPQWAAAYNIPGEIMTMTGSMSPTYYFGGTWEQVGKTGAPETAIRNGTNTLIEPNGESQISSAAYSSNGTGTYIVLGFVTANTSDAGLIMSAILKIKNGGTDVLVKTSRTTKDSGGGCMISAMYKKTDNLTMEASLWTHNYSSTNGFAFIGDLYIYFVPDNMLMWKRIA